MGHQERRTGLFSARTLGSFLGWALCSFLGCGFLGCGFLGFKVLGSLRGFYLLFALLIVARRLSEDQVR